MGVQFSPGPQILFMTFTHLLIGLILGKKFGYTPGFVIGSLFPDIDHLFVLLKNRHFHPKEIFGMMKDEDKYGERYKTPYTHSLLAWALFSSIVAFLFSYGAGIAFLVAYLIHLLLDLLDKDEIQIFYPAKFGVRGFLPVFSFWEIVFGIFLIFIYVQI